jgi:hypothetical protein
MKKIFFEKWYIYFKGSNIFLLFVVRYAFQIDKKILLNMCLSLE